MKIQHLNTSRTILPLAIVSNVTIAWMATAASAQGSVTSAPKRALVATFSETLVRAANDNFMHEQLHNSGSNSSTPFPPEDYRIRL